MVPEVTAATRHQRWLKQFLGIGLLGLVLTGAYVGSRMWESFESAGKGAESPNEEVVELPTLFGDEAKVVAHDFTVENTTDATVEIKEVRSSCGCAKASLDRRVLEPGETTTLHLQADLSSTKGPAHLTCALLLEGGKLFRGYGLKTVTYPRLQFAVPTLLLGQVNPNIEVKKTFTVITHGRSKDDLPTIHDVITSSAEVRLQKESQETEVLANGVFAGKYTYSALLTPKSVSGRNEATLGFPYSYPGYQGNAKLVAVWNVRLPYEPRPARLFFMLRTSDDRVSRQVTIVSVNNETFRVDRIQSPISQLRHKVTTTGGAKTVIEFELEAKNVKESLSEQVTIEIKNQDRSSIVTLPVTAFVDPGDRKGGER